MDRATDLDAIRALRQERTARLESTNSSGSLRAKARAWAGRVTGRADRRYLLAIAEAVDALAAHCDTMAERLDLQFEKESDVSGAFGQEISRLRAEVIHLREGVSRQDQPHT